MPTAAPTHKEEIMVIAAAFDSIHGYPCLYLDVTISLLTAYQRTHGPPSSGCIVS
jgi:hypothetical protein